MNQTRDPFKSHPTENRLLPARYDLSHAVAYTFHYELASWIVELEGMRAFDVSFHFIKTEHAKQIDGLSGRELWEWFTANGYEGVVRELDFRQLCAA